jgi:hypothetical protein
MAIKKLCWTHWPYTGRAVCGPDILNTEMNVINDDSDRRTQLKVKSPGSSPTSTKHLPYRYTEMRHFFAVSRAPGAWQEIGLRRRICHPSISRKFFDIWRMYFPSKPWGSQHALWMQKHVHQASGTLYWDSFAPQTTVQPEKSALADYSMSLYLARIQAYYPGYQHTGPHCQGSCRNPSSLEANEQDRSFSLSILWWPLTYSVKERKKACRESKHHHSGLIYTGQDSTWNDNHLPHEHTIPRGQ